MKPKEQTKDPLQSEKEEMLVWQIVGPISLLCAFFLLANGPLNLDLYAAGLIGLFLSARWHFRGCFYALAALIVLGTFKHSMGGDPAHLWRLGLEGSIACSFFITALAFENSSLHIDALQAQMKASAAALAGVEEDLSKTREEAVQRQMIAAEKLDTMQKDLEEAVAEKGSFEVLNDVLRKVTARHQGEKELVEKHAFEEQRRLAQSQAEIEALQQEISQLKAGDFQVEKAALLDELNEARVEKEQSHLINEKLVRLHAKESVRAQAAIEQLQLVVEEKRAIQLSLRQAIQEAESSMQALKQAEEDKAAHREALEQMGRLRQEKMFLQERLKSLEMEISLLKKTPEELEVLRKERDHLAMQFGKAQEKIHFLSKLEPLHKQLKVQFEEKNQVLHETRAALFHVDTELQTLKIERDQKGMQPIPEALCNELNLLDQELTTLQKENDELQALVTHLMAQMPAGKNSLTKTLDEAISSLKRKKKTKATL
jgi:chromosome segregation ATPase